jgi:hypothetical protein
MRRLSDSRIAVVAVPRQDARKLARPASTAEARREAVSAPLSPARRVDPRRDVSAIRAGLGTACFETAWAEALTDCQIAERLPVALPYVPGRR